MRPKGSAEALEARRLVGGRLLLEGKRVREVSRLTDAAPLRFLDGKKILSEGVWKRSKPNPIQGVLLG